MASREDYSGDGQGASYVMWERLHNKRLLITGVSGALGSYVWRACQSQGLSSWTGVARQVPATAMPFRMVALDLCDRQALSALFHSLRPDFVLHLAAKASLTACAQDHTAAYAVNAIAAGDVAAFAKQANARAFVVMSSTDMVFDGEAAPYSPDHEPAPRTIYGRSKKRGEELFMAEGGDAIARLSLLYGPNLSQVPSFWDQVTTNLGHGEPVPLFVDEWRTPLSYRLAALGLLEILAERRRGLWHLAGPQRLSRYEWGCLLSQALGYDESLLQPTLRQNKASSEPRPRDLSLDARHWFADTAMGEAASVSGLVSEIRAMML